MNSFKLKTIEWKITNEDKSFGSVIKVDTEMIVDDMDYVLSMMTRQIQDTLEAYYGDDEE